MFPTTSTFASSSSYKYFILFIFIIHAVMIASQGDQDDHVVNIGAIIDVNSRIGKEEKTAMEIAVQEYNSVSSHKYKLLLHVNNSGGNPLHALAAAQDLIEEYQAQAIIGMETWQETVLVAQLANQEQVPAISFATPSVTPPLASVRWPSLLRMANNDFIQMQCLAAIVSSYGWRKVIAIYEDDFYSTDSLTLNLVSDALQRVGSEIEQWSAFPPFSTLSHPKTIIRDGLEKLRIQQSRVFIILRSSFQLVTHLFPIAKELGLMGRNSVWITTDSITSLFDAGNSSVMQSMQGVIGIKSHFSLTSPTFKKFSGEFQHIFRSTYLEEDKFEPGIHAVRAYDAISVITHAIEKSTTYNGSSSALLQNILASNFSGLSGEILFNNRELSSPSVYEIVNVIGNSYFRLKFWSPNFGFSDDEGMSGRGDDGGAKTLLGHTIYWPGGDESYPRGWVMPTDAKPLKIGVPGKTSFEKFVKFQEGEEQPTGFSIDIFRAALGKLDYDLPYKFEAFNRTYDELVDQVYLKIYDAVVGDITILANRSNYVEFTQPYAESGLSMIVPVKTYEKNWLFVKPFSKTMWAVTGGIFVYTMFAVWFLEHRSNPQFRGRWKDQLGTALWFTFSTLFFAHRERLQSNYTRVVLVVWLFVVFVVTSSYTASLTSMLTVQRIEPTVTDIETLKRSNSVVGCDGDSFVRKYLHDVLQFDAHNIKNVTSEYYYPDFLSNGTIKAAFLELPYERVFLSRYCKDYKDTGPKYRFGGLAFVFPKGSPIATDISEAILKISENGKITELEKYWFKPTSECSNSDNNTENGSLSIENFGGLFLVTVATSTIMLLLYLGCSYMKFRRNLASSDENLWDQFRKINPYLIQNHFCTPHKSPIPVQALNGVTGEWISSNEECLSQYNTPGHPEESPSVEIEMPETNISRSVSRARVQSLASFPGRYRHGHAVDDMEHPEWHRIPNSAEF